ncbi:MAG: nitroreductase family protein [Acidobacteria bacterium]|nr:nitroreductase family protein [Acidobacteriota bacterium]
MSEPRFIPLPDYREFPPEEMAERADAFYAEVNRRRTIREFSDQPVDAALIDRCIAAAGTAPSGANLQPWHFVVVTDAAAKRRIRVAAEEEEREFYENRAPQEWLDALAPLGTDEHKPFLETAPALIAVFARRWDELPDGGRVKQYYSTESVGLATGLLIAAVHHAGLASLTHTPSPMGFLNEILGRPKNETPFLLLVVGHPAEDCEVPDISRKPLDEIRTRV